MNKPLICVKIPCDHCCGGNDVPYIPAPDTNGTYQWCGYCMNKYYFEKEITLEELKELLENTW